MMGSIIRSTGAVFYSLLHVNSRQGFNELKYTPAQITSLALVCAVYFDGYRIKNNNDNHNNDMYI